MVGVPGRDEGSWAWGGSSAGGEVAVQVVRYGRSEIYFGSRIDKIEKEIGLSRSGW